MYGSMSWAGDYWAGSLFELSPGPEPVVETQKRGYLPSFDAAYAAIAAAESDAARLELSMQEDEEEVMLIASPFLRAISA